MQDVCDRIAILYQGELKELGRVDTLLKMRDVTEIRTTALDDAAKAEIEAVVRRHQGSVLRIDNPTTTLEELFLGIVRDSEAHPGRRPTENTLRGQRRDSSEPLPRHSFTSHRQFFIDKLAYDLSICRLNRPFIPSSLFDIVHGPRTRTIALRPVVGGGLPLWLATFGAVALGRWSWLYIMASR